MRIAAALVFHALASGALLTGCARIETTHQLYDDVVVARPKGPADVVRERPARAYREVAIVRARGDAPLGLMRPKAPTLVSWLRTEAGRVGADAILFPEGGWVREPGGYLRAVAVEWLPFPPPTSPARPAPVAVSPPSWAVPEPPPAPAVPASEGLDDDPRAPDGTMEESRQAADGSWKRFVSADGGRTWVPAPEDEQPPPAAVSGDGGRTWAPAPPKE
jgi:hypothetical protein